MGKDEPIFFHIIIISYNSNTPGSRNVESKTLSEEPLVTTAGVSLLHRFCRHRPPPSVGSTIPFLCPTTTTLLPPPAQTLGISSACGRRISWSQKYDNFVRHASSTAPLVGNIIKFNVDGHGRL